MSLTEVWYVPPDDSQQPASDDVPGPSALVLHLSDILMYEPSENPAAASSSPSARLRGDTCPGVWALGVQWQVGKDELQFFNFNPHMETYSAVATLSVVQKKVTLKKCT